jgi:hypothetical protein
VALGSGGIPSSWQTSISYTAGAFRFATTTLSRRRAIHTAVAFRWGFAAAEAADVAEAFAYTRVAAAGVVVAPSIIGAAWVPASNFACMHASTTHRTAAERRRTRVGSRYSWVVVAKLKGVYAVYELVRVDLYIHTCRSSSHDREQEHGGRQSEVLLPR